MYISHDSLFPKLTLHWWAAAEVMNIDYYFPVIFLFMPPFRFFFLLVPACRSPEREVVVTQLKMCHINTTAHITHK